MTHIKWFEPDKKYLPLAHQEKTFTLFGGQVPAPGNKLFSQTDTDEPIITQKDKKIYCRADLIATAFYILNLETENLVKTRDRYGRYHKKYSNIPEIYDHPVIDQYVTLFRSLLSVLAPDIESKSIWPNGHSFAVALSHDVDRLNTWTFRKAKRAALNGPGPAGWKGKFSRGFGVLKSVLQPERWRGNFSYIVELEKKFGTQSTFFFAVQHRLPRDPQFRFLSDHVKNSIIYLLQNGASVGLHGSLMTAFDKNDLDKERQILQNITNTVILGTRQHYLRFDALKTWPLYESCKFTYDSTAGFASETGYRCGTGFPFYPFNKSSNSAYHFLEIPLVLMDSIFLLEHKLYVKPENAWQIIKKHLEMTRQYNSCLAINWHNNNICPGDVTGNTQIYEKILQWTADHNGWICSLENLAKYWRKKTDEKYE